MTARPATKITNQFTSFAFVAPLCGLILLSLAGDARHLRAVASDLAAVTKAVGNIQKTDISQHLNVLASDTFEGREAGSRGGKAAGIYLVQQLKKFSIRGNGTDLDYFQEFGQGYRNILGILPGSDSELKNEYIVVGAHYDHVGYGNWTNSQGPIGRIHNGADDNASGTSGLLEIAQAFASLPEAPRRTLIFAFWDAEEKGLLGSEHWVANPTVPLQNIRFTVNTDMIGRLANQRVEVFGARSAPGLRRLVSEENQAANLHFDFTWEVVRDSDHYPFYAHRIPFLMLHTGKHDDYHRPSDDIHKLSLDGLQDITRLTFQVVHTLAQADAVPAFRNASFQENNSIRDRLETPLRQPPTRLGLAWSAKQAKEGTIQLTNVRAGSPAERSGLQIGDQIETWNGLPIDKPADFRSLVLTSTNPVEVSIRRVDDEEIIPLTIELDGRPLRVGISWRADPAEPGCVIVSRIVSHSPADRAGLKVADRIHTISGTPVKSLQQFHELVSSLPLPIEFEFERDGRIQQVTVGESR